MGAVQISSKWASRLFSHEQDCIYTSIHSVLDAKPWAVAFDSDGLSHRQGNVSDRVLRGYSCNHCHPLNLHGPLRRLSNCVSQGEPEFHSIGCGDHCVRCHFHLGTSLSLHWRRSEYLSSRTSSSASHFGHALAFADQCVWVHHNIACGDT